MKQKKKSPQKLFLTLLFSSCYFIITAISFCIVIWIRHFLYKSPFFAPDHVPPHTTIYLFALLSIVIGTVLSVFSMRMILKPLRKILEAMNRVSDGDYSVRVEPSGIKRFKKLGNEFNKMVEEIGSAEILKKDFVNNFSHEFKTPITSILGFAKLLKREDLSVEEKEEYVNIIISESERLADLSKNVLTLSRLENEAIVPDVEEVNVSEQIRIAVALFSERLTTKNLDIVFEGDECLIKANKSLLSQVWVNLSDNATKFSPDDSSIKITAQQDENETIVTFANHGKKFDEATKKHIFDRFYQADKSHKTEGNGLGLTLVNAIVVHHGGTIEISSDDEYEVVFTITLPNAFTE